VRNSSDSQTLNPNLSPLQDIPTLSFPNDHINPNGTPFQICLQHFKKFVVPLYHILAKQTRRYSRYLAPILHSQILFQVVIRSIFAFQFLLMAFYEQRQLYFKPTLLLSRSLQYNILPLCHKSRIRKVL
jgi:hypothetical protein